MRKTERLASAYLGGRLETLRLDRGLTATEMAQRIGMTVTTYRWRELGVSQITAEFLLRCHLALGPDALKRIWFPVESAIGAVDEAILAALIEAWDRLARPASYEQIIELCAEAFGVPAGAITGGLSHEKVRQARTAAALVVSSRPHLQLSELAPLVGRSRRTLWWIRKGALNADSEIMRRVEQIQREVDAL